ncbi:tetratricopeptide repeat protein [Edaphobacter aggregans]|uniref:tetratricopeptide repeat protein n=1 Tax=Edaphobacter aggregans TaxID=570835 RepID=UPI0005584B76|nr:tetratricopeptide repeat-containing protein [Edaphobacter aggregans]
MKHGQRDLAGAETLGRLVLEIRTRVLGAEHSDTLQSQNILASLFEEEGKYAEADPLFTRVIEVRQRVLGPKNPDTLDAIAHFGELRIDQARYTEAEAMLRGCLDIQKQTMPSDYRRYLTETLLGASLAGNHKYVEAEPLLVGGYEGIKQNAAAVSDLSRQKMKKSVNSSSSFTPRGTSLTKPPNGVKSWLKSRRCFRTRMQVVTMHRPSEPGYSRPDSFLLDD